MNPGRDDRKHESAVGEAVTSRARSVLRVFTEARRLAPGFLLSCGVLPEISESVTERLHRNIEYLGGEQFGRRRHVLALRRALRSAGCSEKAVDRVEIELTALTDADTKAAYLFGVAVGLSIGALPHRFKV
jgi:hypothetical protein